MQYNVAYARSYWYTYIGKSKYKKTRYKRMCRV